MSIVYIAVTIWLASNLALVVWLLHLDRNRPQEAKHR